MMECLKKSYFNGIAVFILFFCNSHASDMHIERAQEKQLPFVVVIPSYNNKNWYEKNLDSVFSQEYDNYKVIYLDDFSSDGTADLVEAYIEKRKQKKRTVLIKNKKRMYAMANRYRAMHMAAPNEIIVHLDGDDWLAHNKVFSQLNQIYKNKNVWMTYGQFIIYPANTLGYGHQYPQKIINENNFRKYGVVPSHLSTFYAGLFHKIKKEDLMLNGEFFQMAHSAYMYPIIEMAGQHSRFIPEILYIYNKGTSINDSIVNPTLQKYLSSIVKQRPRYWPIQSPF